MKLTAIPTNPKMLDKIEVEVDGQTFGATYYGVVVKQGSFLLTLGGVPTELGGTKGKGWLDVPLAQISSHDFTLTPKVAAVGFDHHWTPKAV